MLLTYRYYDPAEGRFLTRDPIGYAGGLNLYAYCGNNPVGRSDPSGLLEEDELAAWEQLTGAKGFLNAFSAGWSGSANDSRNELLSQAGLCDYANRQPLGIEAIKYGLKITARMAFDIMFLPGGYIDDVLSIAGRRIWNYRAVYSKYFNVDLAGKELHHWIPQRYRYLFKNIKSLSIDDPWNLIPLDKKSHGILTNEWRVWSKVHPNPTIGEVIDKVAETISKYK